MAAAVDTAEAVETRVKPARPDEHKFKAELAQAEKEHAAVQEKLNQIKAKIESAKPNSQESPAAKRQQELRAELAAIRQKQQAFKVARTSVQEKVNALDATLKARIGEQNSSRTRMSFKSAEEIDREIARLEAQVDSGQLRLVDERKALADISALRKQRRNFAGLDEAQKGIDDLRAQIAELKKSLDSPESRALSDQYTAIQKELDAIKAEQDGVFKNLNALRDERSRLHAEQQKKYAAIRELKDGYYKARKAYKEYEDEAWRVRREKQKAQREAFEREKKKKIADQKLDEASRPAYTDEIFVAQGLIRHFDPAYNLAALGVDSGAVPAGAGAGAGAGASASASAGASAGAGAFRAEIGRTVDDSNIQGVRIAKKEDRGDDYFVGTGGKRGKKGKKTAAPAATSAADSGKFNLSFGVIEDLARIKVDPPMNQADVPAVVDKLAAQIVEWKKNQAAKTAENIRKAKDEIARLEAEESAATKANGSAASHATSSEQTDDGVAAVSAELGSTSLTS